MKKIGFGYLLLPNDQANELIKVIITGQAIINAKFDWLGKLNVEDHP
jgi:hypothetical protein